MNKTHRKSTASPTSWVLKGDQDVSLGTVVNNVCDLVAARLLGTIKVELQ